MEKHTNESTFVVLNPLGIEKQTIPLPLGERVSDLKGKVVYCVSQEVGGADGLLRKIAEALPQYIPGVKAEFRKRNSPYMDDDPTLWAEIKENGAAFIYGCAA